MKTKKGTVPNYRITIVPDGLFNQVKEYIEAQNWPYSYYDSRNRVTQTEVFTIHCIGYKTN